ncbi:hypothetical protein ABZ553_02550 [Streptomyces sparsogenes]|uniref:hypothetical protein n=1 Tax=Streptomyces sparsogenes TaxID=67365 RepID=UPI003400D8CD
MPWPGQPVTSPSGTAAPAAGVPSEPGRSEATRLLCAGVYFDGKFRRNIIQELVEHEERTIAPSLGFDALPVLAHALRAHRRETQTALALLALWAAFIALGVLGIGSRTTLFVPWYLGYGLICLASWAARGHRSSLFTLGRSVLKEATRGRWKAVLPILPFVLTVLYGVAVSIAWQQGLRPWAAVAFPALLTLPVWVHRLYVISVMHHQLSRDAFARGSHPQLPSSARYRRIGAAIAREQYSRLVIYDPFRPFVGAGDPYKPWSVVMELKETARAAPWQRRDADSPPRAEPARPGTPEGGSRSAPLTGREVVELIKPQLAVLRTSAAATSRDRLRSLEVDELVYLPPGPQRDQLDRDPEAIQAHLDQAVGEGAEARRHFLRVRVGAWDEQVVICMLVRVHTQGRMLVLEVAPHVLMPVRPEYKSVDVIAAQSPYGLRDAVQALFSSPSAGFAAGVWLVQTCLSASRTWLTNPQYAPPDAPVASVRELGSAQEVSLFQEMDISRYVKTLQDRIAGGVQEALRNKGYETGDFDHYIINVGEGGVFIGDMSGGAVATGEWGSAKHLGIAAEKGSSTT